MSRRIEDLIPAMRIGYAKFEEIMRKAGIDFIVTSTRRTQAEQDALYAQGRTVPGEIVTWTRRSKHIEGKAFDIVIMENEKPDWKITNPKWTKAGEIGEMIGLIWGGSWKGKPDFSHFQLKEDL